MSSDNDSSVALQQHVGKSLWGKMFGGCDWRRKQHTYVACKTAKNSQKKGCPVKKASALAIFKSCSKGYQPCESWARLGTQLAMLHKEIAENTVASITLSIEGKACNDSDGEHNVTWMSERDPSSICWTQVDSSTVKATLKPLNGIEDTELPSSGDWKLRAQVDIPVDECRTVSVDEKLSGTYNIPYLLRGQCTSGKDMKMVVPVPLYRTDKVCDYESYFLPVTCMYLNVTHVIEKDKYLLDSVDLVCTCHLGCGVPHKSPSIAPATAYCSNGGGTGGGGGEKENFAMSECLTKPPPPPPPPMKKCASSSSSCDEKKKEKEKDCPRDIPPDYSKSGEDNKKSSGIYSLFCKRSGSPFVQPRKPSSTSSDILEAFNNRGGGISSSSNGGIVVTSRDVNSGNFTLNSTFRHDVKYERPLGVLGETVLHHAVYKNLPLNMSASSGEDLLNLLYEYEPTRAMATRIQEKWTQKHGGAPSVDDLVLHMAGLPNAIIPNDSQSIVDFFLLRFKKEKTANDIATGDVLPSELQYFEQYLYPTLPKKCVSSYSEISNQLLYWVLLASLKSTAAAGVQRAIFQSLEELTGGGTRVQQSSTFGGESWHSIANVSLDIKDIAKIYSNIFRYDSLFGERNAYESAAPISTDDTVMDSFTRSALVRSTFDDMDGRAIDVLWRVNKPGTQSPSVIVIPIINTVAVLETLTEDNVRDVALKMIKAASRTMNVDEMRKARNPSLVARTLALSVPSQASRAENADCIDEYVFSGDSQKRQRELREKYERYFKNNRFQPLSEFVGSLSSSSPPQRKQKRMIATVSVRQQQQQPIDYRAWQIDIYEDSTRTPPIESVLVYFPDTEGVPYAYVLDEDGNGESANIIYFGEATKSNVGFIIDANYITWTTESMSKKLSDMASQHRNTIINGTQERARHGRFTQRDREQFQVATEIEEMLRKSSERIGFPLVYSSPYPYSYYGAPYVSPWGSVGYGVGSLLGALPFALARGRRRRRRFKHRRGRWRGRGRGRRVSSDIDYESKIDQSIMAHEIRDMYRQRHGAIMAL